MGVIHKIIATIQCDTFLMFLFTGGLCISNFLIDYNISRYQGLRKILVCCLLSERTYVSSVLLIYVGWCLNTRDENRN